MSRKKPTTTSSIENAPCEMREAFSLFDKDGDGTITSYELGVVMRNLGHTPSDDDVERMMQEIDVNSNGSIDYEEFANMMSRKTDTVDQQEEMRQVSLTCLRFSLFSEFNIFLKYLR